MEATCTMNVRQQAFEEFEVSLAVEDNHRNAMRIFWRTNYPKQVLGDDVSQ